MSALPREAVKVVAEAFGFASLSDEASEQVASDLEYRLREIMQEAIKFMRHSKRRRLTTSDINNAFRLRNVEPMYGYSSIAHEAASAASGAAGDKSDKLARAFRKAAGSDVFYIPDKVVSLDDVITAPFPKLPVEPTFTKHWLALDGVQPAIPQNPPITPIEQQVQPQRKEGDMSGMKAEILPLAEHVLSAEQQQLYTHIRESLLSGNKELRDCVLECVRKDPGQKPLLPYFVNFAEDTMRNNLQNLDVLTCIVQFLDALRLNPNNRIVDYVDRFVKTLLTCTIGSPLCSDARQDHWALRKYSARVVSEITTKYSAECIDLQTRVVRTLSNAFLNTNLSFPAHFGAIMCLKGFGPAAVEHFIVTERNLEAYLKFFEKKVKDAKEITRMDGERVKEALLECVGIYYRHRSSEHVAMDRVIMPPANEKTLYTLLEGFFGEMLKSVMPQT